eukprot:TRINITY_DN4695_c0_g1_i1.p1 TRINITY_DN4695_c0_g1~~TRINITY_DN4695_c0_g1_i1.p1  ORF type:complete len:387 (+),score=41.87 TRINITY_DN4695_c0_g1_i1:75-1235(+)
MSGSPDELISAPIAIGGKGAGRSEMTGTSGAFSLDGRSYLRSYEEQVSINYESIDINYDRPEKQEKRELGDTKVEDVKAQLSEGIMGYFKTKTCYDSINTSTQVVVIDVNLPLRTAFISALENKVSFGVLWNSSTETYVGLMTVTDYINILLRTRTTSESIVDLQNNNIDRWMDYPWVKERRKEFASVRMDHEVYDAVLLLQKNKISHVPLMSHAAEVVSVLTYPGILSLALERLSEVNDKDWLSLLDYSVKDLSIGVYKENMITVRLETPVHEILQLLISEEVHCLPIVDHKNRCLDVFTRSDVMHIEQGGTYDIEISLASAIQNRPRHPVFCFSPDDPLAKVMSHINKCGVTTLIAVDEEDRVCGSLSVQDIFSWLLSVEGSAT